MRWLVSSTDMIATPTELAICCTMFSSVDPRATSCEVSVFSAEVMIGIIVPPMPRPITNRVAMSTVYDVVEVIWVSENIPPMISSSPNGTIRPTGSLSVSAPGDRHGDHGADALRRHQQPGVQRRLAAHLLEVGRHQQQAAEERHGEQEHGRDRHGQVAVAEQPQVQQRVGRTERVQHEQPRSSPAPIPIVVSTSASLIVPLDGIEEMP